MKNLLAFFIINGRNELIALLFFIGGAVLGGILTFVLYKIFAIKKRGNKKASPLKDVQSVIDESTGVFLARDEGFEKEKLAALLEGVSILLENIPKKYNEKVKFVTLLSADEVEFIEKDLKISLDFTAYELVYFLREFFEALREEIIKLLQSKEVKDVYGVGKVVNTLFFREQVAKNVEDLKVSTVIGIVKRIKPDPNKKNGLIGKAVGAVFKKVKSKALDKSVDVVEPYAVEIMETFAESLNALYAGEIIPSTNAQLPKLEEEGA